MTQSATAVFGDRYSGSYDLIYRDKDYDRECTLLESIFAGYGEHRTRTVLDLGCGTGNHSIRLASHGFQVAGVDMSAHMLRTAERKAAQANVSIEWHQSDIRAVNLNRQFDAVLMMFAVLGYQLENEDVLRALRTARSHLAPGGLFVCDVWHGPAVLGQQPQDRMRVIQDHGRTLLRMSSGVLDSFRHRCHVDIRIWEIAGSRVCETREEHRMRYFFPQELALFLNVTGFQLRRLGAFPEIDQEATERTWNVFAVAEAI
jgi:SAM-dependent methyltransferase